LGYQETEYLQKLEQLRLDITEDEKQDASRLADPETSHRLQDVVLGLRDGANSVKKCDKFGINFLYRTPEGIFKERNDLVTRFVDWQTKMANEKMYLQRQAVRLTKEKQILDEFEKLYRSYALKLESSKKKFDAMYMYHVLDSRYFKESVILGHQFAGLINGYDDDTRNIFTATTWAMNQSYMMSVKASDGSTQRVNKVYMLGPSHCPRELEANSHKEEQNIANLDDLFDVSLDWPRYGDSKQFPDWKMDPK